MVDVARSVRVAERAVGGLGIVVRRILRCLNRESGRAALGGSAKDALLPAQKRNSPAAKRKPFAENHPIREFVAVSCL